jgi:hypothetical protein
VLRLPAFRAGFLVTGFARLLRGPGSPADVATLGAPLTALRLRERRRDATTSEHHDGSQDTNASPKPHLSLHTVLLWCSDRSLKPPFPLGQGRAVSEQLHDSSAQGHASLRDPAIFRLYSLEALEKSDYDIN